MKKTTRLLFGVAAVIACGIVVGFVVMLIPRPKKWGVYDIDYSRTLSPGYEVRVLHHEEHVMFRVQYKDRPIAEMRVYPESIATCVIPYKAVAYDKPDSSNVFCDGTNITTVRYITEGDNVIRLVDRNNDGFPELRTTNSSTAHVYEDIEPIFTLKEKIDKSGEQMDSFDKK